MAYPNSDINGAIYTDPVDGQQYIYDATLALWYKSSAPVSTGYVHETLAVTVDGATVFTLAAMPTATAPTMASVNGVDYWQPDWTLAGNVFTWAGPITLETTDKLVVSYTV